MLFNLLKIIRMKNKWYNNLKKILFFNVKYSIFIAFLMLFTVLWMVFALKNDVNNTNIKESFIQDTTKKTTPKVYEHTSPERISKNDYFKWEFISNEVASIYPRRESLVKDILVDIWDEIEEGDTLATLFTPWVQGESNTKLNIKRVDLDNKGDLLSDMLKVKTAKLSELDWKILEKETLLKDTEINFQTKISKLETFLINKENFEENAVKKSFNSVWVEEKTLVLLQDNLKTLISLQEENINSSLENIKQKKDVLENTISYILSQIIQTLHMAWNSSVTYGSVYDGGIAQNFGTLNPTIGNTFFSKLEWYNLYYKDYEISKKYEDFSEILVLFSKSLKNTTSYNNLTQEKIDTAILEADQYILNLLTKKEAYDDAINTYEILIKTEDDKENTLINKIEKQKEVIGLMESSYELVKSWKNKEVDDISLDIEKLKSDRDLQINKLKSEIHTLLKTKLLLEVSENKNITMVQNQISTAKANLNNEYVKSWDYKIISPFSWIISKRWVQIWEKISPNTEAFRLTWVETSLSKITKKEIKFYVPENLKENIEIGQEVTFSQGRGEKNKLIWTIYRISPEIDERTFNITVQAKVDNNIALPNKSTLRVNLETKENIFKIPTTSIYNKNERKIVYYKKDNWKLWVRDINIISDDWEYSLVSWEFDETLKIVTTPIFIK